MNYSNNHSVHPLLKLWRYTQGQHILIMLSVLCSILNKIFDLAPPVLIGIAVDVVVAKKSSLIAHWGFTDLYRQLWILAAITVIAWGLESVFEYAYAVLWRNLSQTIQHQLRIDAYRHVQDLDMAFFEDHRIGELMSVLNNDVNQLERFLDVGANDILQLLTTVVAVLILFAGLAPSLCWMVIIPMPFVIWGSFYFQKKVAPSYASVRKRVGILNSQLSNNLTGISTIKSYTAEDREFNTVSKESFRYQETNKQAIAYSSAFVPIIRMIIVLGFIAIMVYGGRLVLHESLSVGVYSILVFMTQRLLWPLTQLGNTMDLYQRAMASIDRVFNLLKIRKTITEGTQHLLLAEVRGDIVFEHISFSYHSFGVDKSHNPVRAINDLTLKISAGDSVAFVGPTGAGKTTVIKLLLRFYDVNQGRISLDGYDIRSLLLKDLRTAVGLVSQDVYLVHGTVRDNIRYGSFQSTDEEVIEAAKIAEAHEFIMALHKGYDTLVGERGQKLSGGQRQRLSIARAILKNPPVLILDEATSAVDNETEAAIQRSLARVAVGRTMIIIAHRLSTVRNVDCIFVLDQGRLIEQGTHMDLIKQEGIYANLWKVQMGLQV